MRLDDHERQLILWHRNHEANYKAMNDEFEEFMNDTIVCDIESDHFMTLGHIFAAYKEWHKGMHGPACKHKPRKQKDLSAFLDKEYSTYYREETQWTKRGYKGLILWDLVTVKTQELTTNTEEDVYK